MLVIVNIIIIMLIVYFGCKTSARENFSNTKVTLFTRQNCGYCTKLKKGSWNEFKKYCELKKYEVNEVQMDKQLDSNAYKAVGGEHNIPGVPYIIKIVNNGPPNIYSGNRSLESLKSWVD